MGLFQRIGDIVSANVNEMVERFEDPEIMLRQAIAEMHDAVESTMESAARVIADERLAARQLAQQQELAEQHFERARAAVLRGDQAAARSSLLRRHEHQRIIAALTDQVAAARSLGSKLKRQLDAMRVRLAEAQRKQHTIAARNRVNSARRLLLSEFRRGDSGTGGTGRFDRLARQIERAEVETEVLCELCGVEPIDDLPEGLDREIEEQLNALQQQVQ